MIAAASGRGRRECIAVAALAVASLVIISGSVATGHLTRAGPAAAALLVFVAAFHAQVLSWRSLIGLTVLIILFVPIRRYSLPASLPINLEPYRIVVAFVIVAWVLTLLIDRRLSIRASGFETPLFAYLGAVVLSLLANLDRVEATGTYTLKSLSFLLSYVIVFYIFVSVLRRAKDIDFFVRLLVTGGGIVGAFASSSP